MTAEVRSPEGELLAAQCRQRVADQLYAALVESAYPGSRDTLALRLRAVMEAERRAEPVVLRSALMDLAVTTGSWIASIDTTLPREPEPRRRRRAGSSS